MYPSGNGCNPSYHHFSLAFELCSITGLKFTHIRSYARVKYPFGNIYDLTCHHSSVAFESVASRARNSRIYLDMYWKHLVGYTYNLSYHYFSLHSNLHLRQLEISTNPDSMEPRQENLSCQVRPERLLRI